MVSSMLIGRLPENNRLTRDDAENESCIELAAEAASRLIIIIMTESFISMVARTPVDTMTGRKKTARAIVRPLNSLLSINAAKKLKGTTTSVSRIVNPKEVTMFWRNLVSIISMFL
jgi:hypothetical protein